MPKKSEVGKIGEEIAAEYLKEKKYRVLHRNVKQPGGELDIIARAPDGMLVFIEVKTLWGSGETFSPEQNYSPDKARKTHRTAQGFSARYPELIDDQLGFRVDLVTVLIKNNLLHDWHQDCEVKHYKNV